MGTGHGQVCWKEGDPRVDKTVFNTNKKQQQSGKKNDVQAMKDDDGNNGKKVKIPLKVYKFNGCFGDFHPRNLLNDDFSWYRSKYNSVKGDWLIFEVADGKKYAPKWLKIKNDYLGSGIKDIRLQFGAINKWTNEQSIKNIEKKEGDQWFALDCVQPASF